MSERKYAKHQPTGDYETGYCRTPVHSRFKKGQSGNPKGRPRKTPDARDPELLEDVLREELDELVWIQDSKGRRQITRRRALILAQLKKRLSGDRAGERLLDRDARRQAVEQECVQEIEVTMVFEEEDEKRRDLVRENRELQRRLEEAEAERDAVESVFTETRPGTRPPIAD